MGIPEGEKKGIEIIFRVIIAENALNLGRQMNIKIHEAPTNSKQLDQIGPQQDTLHLRCQKPKIKIILKAAREKLRTRVPPQDYQRIFSS